jgi:hypothetical protein
VVDVSGFGTALEINSETWNTNMVPAVRFVSWKEAEQYFRANEADAESIDRARDDLSRHGTAVLTIV